MVVVRWIFYCVVLVGLWAGAALSAETPSAGADTDGHLPAIEENKKIAENSGNAAVSALYGLIAAQVKLTELANADAAKYAESIDRFAVLLDDLQHQYQKNTFAVDQVSPDSFAQFDLIFNQLDAELLRLQKRKTDLNQLSANILVRASLIPSDIRALMKEEAGATGNFVLTGNAEHDDAVTQLRVVTVSRIAAQREALEMERLSSKNRLELLHKEQAYLEEHIQRLAKNKLEWQRQRGIFADEQHRLLRKEVEQQVARAGHHATIAQLAANIFTLIDQWTTADTDWRNVLKQRESLERTLAELAEEKQTFENELAVSSASAMLGVPLVERYSSALRAGRIDEDALKVAHLQRMRLNAQPFAPRNRLGLLRAQTASLEAGLTPQQLSIYRQLIDKYDYMYRETDQIYDSLIVELVKYQGVHSDLSSRAEDMRRLITTSSLWVANVPAVDVLWLRQIADGAVRLVQALWKETVLEIVASFSTVTATHGLVLLALLMGVGRYLARKRFVCALEGWSAQVGVIKNDRIASTLSVVVASVALSAVWVSPYFLLGQYLRHMDSGGGQLQAVGAMLMAIARFLFVIRFLSFATLPKGFLLGHLQFPATLGEAVVKVIRVAEWLGVVLIGACILTLEWPDAVVSTGIGRLFFVLLAVFVSLWIGFLVKEIDRMGTHLQMRSRWMGVLKFVLPAVPWLSAAAALLGYFFLAKNLLVNAHDTFLVLLSVLLVVMILRRVFSIHERRLAYDRAVAHRKEERAKRKKVSDDTTSEQPIEIEDFEVDTTVLRSRSMSLLQFVAYVVFFGAVMHIWADFLLAFDGLKNVALWETVRSVGENQRVDVVTLRDLLVMVLIFVITAILAMNLPSLIELLILQNLSLERGVGFAIMTITSYVVVIVGVLMGFATIGMDWSKMQWLVAALGVGVGFGLQEVVANFVSGLILLFERPIRLGDMITVEGESGVVSRIRMRATTIVDSDHREIIVPNKILLSQKITNWSLTDGMTRVVVAIGVGYESDVPLVTQLLLQAAKESPLVLKEPQPEAYFNGFGNSTLDFELRIFASELGRRMPLRHDLHERILTLFRANDINIAYPQLDVHVLPAAPSGSDQGAVGPV